MSRDEEYKQDIEPLLHKLYEMAEKHKMPMLAVVCVGDSMYRSVLCAQGWEPHQKYADAVDVIMADEVEFDESMPEGVTLQ